MSDKETSFQLSPKSTSCPSSLNFLWISCCKRSFSSARHCMNCGDKTRTYSDYSFAYSSNPKYMLKGTLLPRTRGEEAVTSATTDTLPDKPRELWEHTGVFSGQNTHKHCFSPVSLAVASTTLLGYKRKDLVCLSVYLFLRNKEGKLGQQCSDFGLL